MTKRTVVAVLIAIAAAGSACQQAPVATSAGGGGGAAQVQASEADRAFIDGMVPHHQVAILMADAALALAGQIRDEVRDLARRIVEAQRAEQAQLRSWAAA